VHKGLAFAAEAGLSLCQTMLPTLYLPYSLDHTRRHASHQSNGILHIAP